MLTAYVDCKTGLAWFKSDFVYGSLAMGKLIKGQGPLDK